mmetsp:Transcript_53357/g.62318  ORF Transcript_53357/g.62318 Transcript_53357/m.62318 type:complete len:185 (-) Transcript_53357:468-1022(-)|eukprot:CAMPEP_0194387926 /NCGR_PEP_ID=MMETSP0174-20130528/95256_1 /TAXON_ID=216777 /ORGANISM="Proboscia alata, Strain PI-D3" /LENGTH=184 /DNA_ID=CAMNT_0039178645 /DNA_START=42 /DNA_END=596 /DNA_ORIENTATION=+
MVAKFYLSLLLLWNTYANVIAFQRVESFMRGSASRSIPFTALQMSTSENLEIEIVVPPANKRLSAQIKCVPLLEVPSKLVEVRYKLPFGLDVSPIDQKAVVTKAGPGGEQAGDIFRYTSQWTMGLPRGDGILTTAASFSGSVAWQCSLFDVMRAQRWEDVVDALTSNIESRTDEVVLIFERPIE